MSARVRVNSLCTHNPTKLLFSFIVVPINLIFKIIKKLK